MVQRCKSCGAEIEWVKTEYGKNLILDKEPNKDGNVVLLMGKNGNVFAKVMKQGDSFPGKPKRISHWATCPQSNQWRGNGGKEEDKKFNLAMNWVRKANENTYRYIIEKGLLSKPHLAMYEALFHSGPLTLREINDRFGGPDLHSRLIELEKLGVAVEIGFKVCSITNQESMSWDVTNKLPMLHPVMTPVDRPDAKAIMVTLDELRDLYQMSRTRPSEEVKSVMLWLKNEAIF